MYLPVTDRKVIMSLLSALARAHSTGEPQSFADLNVYPNVGEDQLMLIEIHSDRKIKFNPRSTGQRMYLHVSEGGRSTEYLVTNDAAGVSDLNGGNVAPLDHVFKGTLGEVVKDAVKFRNSIIVTR